MGFFRQEYWSGFPFLPPRDPPDPGMEPAFPESPALSGGFIYTELPVRPHSTEVDRLKTLML